ncbi:hypothetical protein FGIG_09124 [Fasciola gigantica]|uniref:Uncharacterized protein n=1 Tax=Fasciola gigantica TaxID=46835 RepID=A0A504Z3V3_FASGI|nr:hypothetical protein FGIG_09124 [Fasciola gigantica]
MQISESFRADEFRPCSIRPTNEQSTPVSFDCIVSEQGIRLLIRSISSPTPFPRTPSTQTSCQTKCVKGALHYDSTVE